jgi:hypothetical protein
MGTRRFPAKDIEFNGYIQEAEPYLNANKLRLLISADNITQLTNLKANWDSCYPESQNKTLRTTAIIIHKDESREALKDLLRAIYDDIPESVLTPEDRLTLHLNKRDTVPTRRGMIVQIPFMRVKVQAGSVISFICRKETDFSRASILKGADAVEVVYSIGDTVPASAEACSNTISSTKAIFDLRLSSENAGDNFYCFARWVNHRDASKNGPWTEMMNVIITK